MGVSDITYKISIHNTRPKTLLVCFTTRHYQINDIIHNLMIDVTKWLQNLPLLWGGASCSDRKRPWHSGWRWDWPWCLARLCYVTWGFSPVPLVTPVRTAVRRRL